MVERGKCQVCAAICETRCSFCRAVYYCSKEHQKKNWAEHKENCTRRKFKVDTNEKLGRFLVATESIEADDILFKDKPLVLAPKIGLLDTEDIICLGCYKLLSSSDSSDEDEEEVAENSSCSKCGLPVCSTKCASHYFHKHFECKLFREAAKAKLPLQQQRSPQAESQSQQGKTGNDTLKNGVGDGNSTPATKPEKTIATLFTEELKENFIQNLLLFRCLLLKYVNTELWDTLMLLQSNNEFREDLGNLEKTARIFEEMKNIVGIIGHPTIDKISKPDLHKILGILDTNAVDFKISTNMELTGIFPTFSMMEYSCIPSTRFYFVPPVKNVEGKSSNKHTYELFVRSAVPLSTGDHLSYTITNILWNTQKRREELKKTKYFWCECPRCIDPYEMDSNFSSILCPLPACKAVSIPVPKQSGISVVTVAGAGSSSDPTNAVTAPASPTSLMTPGVSTDREYQWQCSNKKCGKTCETWQVKKVDSKLSEAIGKLTSKASIKDYKDMQAQFDQLVHPDYYLNFVVNHSLIQLQGHDPISRNDKQILEDKLTICNRLLGTIKKLDPGLAKLNIYAAVIYFEMHSAILAIAGGEGEEDYKILRKQPETVKLGRVYLQKCIDCFQYELLNSPETKLKVLAKKKLEYLNMLLKHA